MRAWGSGENTRNKSHEVLKELIQILFENHDIILKKHLDVTVIILEHVIFMRMCIWLQNKQFLLLKVRAMFLYLSI